MKSMPRLPLLFELVALFPLIAVAADTPKPDPTARLVEMRKIADSLKPQSGDVVIGNGLAKVTLPRTLRYLNSADTGKVLTDLWHNPKDNDTLGMLVPVDFDPLSSHSWVVVMDYEENGYVKDDDAAKIDYADLLQKMKASAGDLNKERVKEGYSPVELIGWATPPRYDAQTKKLYWAKELKFGDRTQHTLNYNIRMLGRRGVLVLNAVAKMDQLKTIETATPDILKAVNFQEGNRYSDFNSSTDKTATYGLAALVAGGIALKTGLLKTIWIAVLALKKFIIIALAAAAATIKKLLGRIKGRSVANAAVASSDTPPPPDAS